MVREYVYCGLVVIFVTHCTARAAVSSHIIVFIAGFISLFALFCRRGARSACEHMVYGLLSDTTKTTTAGKMQTYTLYT